MNKKSQFKLNKTDQYGYNKFYKHKEAVHFEDKQKFLNNFERRLKPFYKGGHTKGFGLGKSVQLLLEAAVKTGKNYGEITVIDAGCGLGELTAYLAIKGFNVIGIDIAKEATTAGERLVRKLGVHRSASFYATSLEQLPLPDNSVDFIMGHASLHHFIKYQGVPVEFNRVLKPGGCGYFVDSFGENKLYSVFHNKRMMAELGDVSLTKKMINCYFKDLNPVLVPTDWFVMLDKLYLKVFPSGFNVVLRGISRLHFWLDRKMPANSRMALALSGSILTIIKKS